MVELVKVVVVQLLFTNSCIFFATGGGCRQSNGLDESTYEHDAKEVVDWQLIFVFVL